MNITEITEKSEWEKILEKFSGVCFLQSWNWGEFQKSLGSKVFRVVVTDKTQSAAASYYIKKSRLFTYLYLPRGPLAEERNQAIKLLENLKEVAKAEKVDFILIEPPEVDWNLPVYFISQPSMQPESSSLVSLTPTNEVLQSSLRKTTRQMIKKASEAGVKISSYSDLSHWDEFVALFKETTQRQGFNPHSINYMKKQLEIFAKYGEAKLYLARSGKNSLAGAVIVSYGSISVYLHAASTYEGRKIGAAQLLVWKAIQDAKEAGDKIFDLWGVAPDDNPKHPWAGISIFKNGFGGEIVNYPGGFILPINLKKYKLYRLTNFLRNFSPLKNTQRALLRAIIKG